MIRNSKRMARTGDQRCAAIGYCAGCKHIPTSRRLTKAAIGVLGAIAEHDSVPAEVVALQTLNPHASKPCWRRGRRLPSAFIPSRPFQQSAQLNPAGHLSPTWREPRRVFSPVSPLCDGENPISLWPKSDLSSPGNLAKADGISL
jgi:hypothetical protein